MKFVKALNQGIVTDLGIGSHVYNITTEGCEVEDSVAAKIKEVFAHLVEVTDVPVQSDTQENVDISITETIKADATAPVAPVEVAPVAPVETTPVAPAPTPEQEVQA